MAARLRFSPVLPPLPCLSRPPFVAPLGFSLPPSVPPAPQRLLLTAEKMAPAPVTPPPQKNLARAPPHPHSSLRELSRESDRRALGEVSREPRLLSLQEMAAASAAPARVFSGALARTRPNGGALSTSRLSAAPLWHRLLAAVFSSENRPVSRKSPISAGPELLLPFLRPLEGDSPSPPCPTPPSPHALELRSPPCIATHFPHALHCGSPHALHRIHPPCTAPHFPHALHPIHSQCIASHPPHALHLILPRALHPIHPAVHCAAALPMHCPSPFIAPCPPFALRFLPRSRAPLFPPPHRISRPFPLRPAPLFPRPVTSREGA